MGGRRSAPAAPVETEEQKAQKIAIKNANNSSGGGKEGVGKSEFDSTARKGGIRISGGSRSGGGSSFSGARGGGIGANIP